MTEGFQGVGIEAAKAYIRKPHRLEVFESDEENPIDRYTDRPSMYGRRRVRARLLPVLASLPPTFFHTVTVQRDVRFYVSPEPPGLWTAPPDEIWPAHGSRAQAVRPFPSVTLLGADFRAQYRALPIVQWNVTLGRVTIELHGPEAFAGVVIHELSHVYLQHDVDAWDLTDDEWQRVEDEAIAFACAQGFRAETKAYLESSIKLWGDETETGRLPPEPVKRG